SNIIRARLGNSTSLNATPSVESIAFLTLDTQCPQVIPVMVSSISFISVLIYKYNLFLYLENCFNNEITQFVGLKCRFVQNLKMAINFQSKATQWSVLLLLSLIWGSSFILMKKGMVAYSDTQVAALRIFSAFIFMLPLGVRYLSQFKRKDFLALLIVG